MQPAVIETKPRDGLVTLTHVMYGLHAFSALMGIITPAFIVTAFLTGWPSIVAVILNYVKRSDVRGSYLDSHFSWQLRTFWYALLWTVVAGLVMISFTGIPLAAGLPILSFIGVPLALILFIGVGLWVLYRIIRGWLALTENKPVAGRSSRPL